MDETEDPAGGEAGASRDGSGGEGSGPEPPSLPGRVVALFVSPGDLFRRLAGQPRWIGAVVLGAFLVAGSTALVPSDLFARAARSALLQAGGAPEGFDAERFASIQKTTAVIGNGVFHALWTAGLAGITTLVFTFLLGDGGRYRQHLAIVAHAGLVPAVGLLLVTPLRIAAGDLTLSLHLGLLLPATDGWLGAFVGGLDLFQIWVLVLIAAGVARLDPRRATGSAVLLLLALQLGVSAVVATVVT